MYTNSSLILLIMKISMYKKIFLKYWNMNWKRDGASKAIVDLRIFKKSDNLWTLIISAIAIFRYLKYSQKAKVLRSSVIEKLLFIESLLILFKTKKSFTKHPSRVPHCTKPKHNRASNLYHFSKRDRISNILHHQWPTQIIPLFFSPQISKSPYSPHKLKHTLQRH